MQQAVDQRREQRRPVLRRQRVGGLPAQRVDGLQEGPQRAQRQRGAAFGLAGGQAAVERAGPGGQGMAEEQAVQAVGPGVADVVAGIVTQAQALPLCAVEGPVHAGIQHPAVDAGQALVVQPEALRHHRLLQQAECGAGGAA